MTPPVLKHFRRQPVRLAYFATLLIIRPPVKMPWRFVTIGIQQYEFTFVAGAESATHGKASQGAGSPPNKLFSLPDVDRRPRVIVIDPANTPPLAERPPEDFPGADLLSQRNAALPDQLWT